jgi:OOP family OmpA-OmpF porin
MKFFKFSLLALFVLIFFFSGCAVHQCNDSLKPGSLKYEGNNYSKKIDNLIIISDTSSSMENCSGGQTCFSMCKNIVKNMVSGLPSDIDINTAYLTFGHHSYFSSEPNLIISELEKFDQDRSLEKISEIKKAGGTSRLDLSLADADSILENASGTTALFIIGDGIDITEKSFEVVDKITEKNGSDICIYPIHAGNSMSGKKAYENFALSAECGMLYKAEALKNENAVASMLSQTVYNEVVDTDQDGVSDEADRCKNTPIDAKVDKYGCPLDSDGDGVYDYLDECPDTPESVSVDNKGCPLDSDNDGVYDYKDNCPDTKTGLSVDDKGCPVPTSSDKVVVTEEGTWIYKDIQFNTGKTSINENSAAVLDEVVKLLKQNNELKLEIQGHTDNRGDTAFNYRLSQQRADAVKNYLIEKGIKSNRLTSKGFGPSKPVVTNDTVGGRSQNRRVEFKPLNN